MDRSDANEGRIERAKDRALGAHDDHPGAGDLVGEAAGGVTGVLAGAAIGSAGGPIGTILGGLAGAVGGWWSGRAIAEAAKALTEDDDRHFRAHFERSRPAADRRYEDARPAYHLGHVASHNPEYHTRAWDEVEPEIRKGWTDDVSARHGSWESMAPYAAEGFERGRRGVSGTRADATRGREIERGTDEG